MKVLQVLPELNSGGVERGTLELANHLAASGHESLVLSGGGRMVADVEAGGSRHLTLPVGRKRLATLALVPRLRRLLRDEQPDILHLRSRVPAWVMWLAWRGLPEGRRPRLVTTVHGFYSVNRWSAIMCRGERVICVSDSTRRYVVDHYPDTPTERLRVVPRGISPEDYRYGFRADEAWCAAFAEEFPETRGKRLITLPGRITRLKGHGDFLRVLDLLRDLPDIHGLVVGGAHPRKREYEAELHQRVAEAGLDGRVTFTGLRRDLREILSISSLVVSLTSQPESFGRTTLEALAMGVPVAGYALGGVEEQLRTLYPAGLLAPGDTEAAAGRIRELLDEPGTVSRDNPFTLDRMLAGILAVYRELVSTK